ncbi:universal stress protein [Maribacter arcticus]|uniref:Nucleotide-binding universal stress protein, UspA family n=1 Tax=Maribacter arcticus TaxID=561365 RepID=A0A1T5CHS7_9FLAO|nr:universal stress protein [Maribacter arcticus]SKB58680.1 Nucleotide-binding universal stress protein, UspA family [Maribacter arcticus]
MQHILATTDFSSNAYNALFYATQLLRNKACTFYILNTYEEHTPLTSKRIPTGKGDALLDQLSDESEEGLKITLHKIVLDNGNTNHMFKTISTKGDLVEAISKTVERNNVDLVVMGNKGTTAAKAIFMGSSAVETINTMKLCPLLMVPGEIDFEPVKKIAFVTDYKRSFNLKVISPLLFMASLFNASIRIFRVLESESLDETQKSNRDVLKQYLDPVDYKVEWMPNFSNKTKTINNFLKDSGIDMLTMINYEKGFLKKLVQGSLIKKVSFNLDIPFLIIPSED